MSSEVDIALIGVVGTLIGTLVGTLGGIGFTHWLRTRGDVRCALGSIDTTTLRIYNGGTRSEPVHVTDPESLESLTARGGEVVVRYTLDLRFFNEKDEATGLSEVSVAFIGKDGRKAVLDRNSRGFSADSGGPAGATVNLAMDVVNLPSQTWVGMNLEGILVGETVAQSLAWERTWERIEIRAKFPNGKPFRKIVRKGGNG